MSLWLTICLPYTWYSINVWFVNSNSMRTHLFGLFKVRQRLALWRTRCNSIVQHVQAVACVHGHAVRPTVASFVGTCTLVSVWTSSTAIFASTSMPCTYTAIMVCRHTSPKQVWCAGIAQTGMVERDFTACAFLHASLLLLQIVMDGRTITVPQPFSVNLKMQWITRNFW